jgi:hypothetical protein
MYILGKIKITKRLNLFLFVGFLGDWDDVFKHLNTPVLKINIFPVET